MSRSSTSSSSSRTLDLRTVPAHWLFSLLVALVVVLGTEVAARVFMSPLGDRVWAYWSDDAVDKFEWYRDRVASGRVPAVIAVGDATGARGFDPRVFSETAGAESYNLAWPANFPLALPVTTLPLLEELPPPETVFLFQTPASYVAAPEMIRVEQSIRDSLIGKRVLGASSAVIDSVYLARLYPARFYLIRHWIHGAPLYSEPALQGLLPLDGTDSEELDAAAVESWRNAQFSEPRRAVLRELTRIAAARGFRLIVIVPPSLLPDPTDMTTRHVTWLRELEADARLDVWNYASTSGLAADHFWNVGHLNREGASLFSAILADRYGADE